MSTTTGTAAIDRTIAVINGKGGVYKTSIVSSVGALIAEAGSRVLLIDLDPQGNLSEDLGLADSTDGGQHQLYVVPQGRPFIPQPTGRDRLDTIHGGRALHDLTSVLVGRQGRDPQWMHSFANSIAGVADNYDFILIDCPPGNEALQTIALIASRYVLIPTRADASSRKGLREVAARFTAVRPLNPDLELLGVVRTGITVSAKNIRESARVKIEEDLGGAAPVLTTVVRYAESPATTVRDRGRLPHELEPDEKRFARARLEHLRERKRLEKLAKKDSKKGGNHRAARGAEAEVHLSPTIGGLAQDYAELTQEVLDLVAAAEEREEAASA